MYGSFLFKDPRQWRIAHLTILFLNWRPNVASGDKRIEQENSSFTVNAISYKVLHQPPTQGGRTRAVLRIPKRLFKSRRRINYPKKQLLSEAN